MLQTMENYLTKKLENGATYRDLIEIFEIPLLKAARRYTNHNCKWLIN